MVHMTHDSHYWRTQLQLILGFLFGVFKVFGLEFGLLLLASVNQLDTCAQLCGKKFNHIVRQGLGSGNRLTLKEQKSNHVPSSSVELGTDLLGRTAALYDDLTSGNRRI